MPRARLFELDSTCLLVGIVTLRSFATRQRLQYPTIWNTVFSSLLTKNLTGSPQNLFRPIFALWLSGVRRLYYYNKCHTTVFC